MNQRLSIKILALLTSCFLFTTNFCSDPNFIEPLEAAAEPSAKLRHAFTPTTKICMGIAACCGKEIYLSDFSFGPHVSHCIYCNSLFHEQCLTHKSFSHVTCVDGREHLFAHSTQTPVYEISVNSLGKDLSLANFSDISFEQHNATRCSDTNFTKARFERSTFKSITFENCIFDETVFCKTSIDSVTFKNCSFVNTNFTAVKFLETQFIECDLNGATFDVTVFDVESHYLFETCSNLDKASFSRYFIRFPYCTTTKIPKIAHYLSIETLLEWVSATFKSSHPILQFKYEIPGPQYIAQLKECGYDVMIIPVIEDPYVFADKALRELGILPKLITEVTTSLVPPTLDSKPASKHTDAKVSCEHDHDRPSRLRRLLSCLSGKPAYAQIAPEITSTTEKEEIVSPRAVSVSVTQPRKKSDRKVGSVLATASTFK